MKKLLIVLFLMLFSFGQVLAANLNYGFKGPLNLIQSKILEKIISTQIKKVLHGNFKTKINSYGAKGLRRGIFKSAEISGRNLEFKSIGINEFYAKTISEKNRLDISNKSKPKLLSDIQAEYKAILTNDNLESLTSAPVIKKEFDKINNKLAPFLSIYKIKLQSDSGRIKFKIGFISNIFGTKFTVSGSANLSCVNETLVLSDINFGKKIKNIEKFINTLNNINLSNIIIQKSDDVNVYLTVKNLNIIDDKIEIFGIINVYRGGQ